MATNKKTSNSGAMAAIMVVAIIAALGLIVWLISVYGKKDAAPVTSPTPTPLTTVTPTPIPASSNPNATTVSGQEFLETALMATENQDNIVGVYDGILPCADCPGITTVLALETTMMPGDGGGTYQQYLEYQGRDLSVILTGTWNLQRGTDQDENASVYALTDSQTGEMSFYKETADGLEKLDNQGYEITAGFPSTLTKVGASPTFAD